MKRGKNQNASKVLRDGLRVIENRELEEKARLHALRNAARVGIDDADAGRVRDFTGRAELRQYLDSLAKRTVKAARSR